LSYDSRCREADQEARVRVLGAFLLAALCTGCGSTGDGDQGGDQPGGNPPVGGDDASAPPSPGGPFVGNLGAIPYDGGVSFRVWAPAADQVFVSGDFNQWSDSATPMQGGSDGVFSADVDGASAGQAYQYLVHHAGQVLTRQDPRARAVKSPTGPSLIVDPAFAWTTPADWTPPPVEQQVIYELHLGTFNPPAGTVAGTFATAADKLDYLASLGVNMVELMPPAEYPTTTSWGYNPDFPFAIQQSYGTPDDLRRLVDAAHAHGIGVLIDVVHNHWSSKNQMNCFDGACNPTAGDLGIYFYSDAARAKTPWGPRPDFGRAEVAQFILDNALSWSAEYRCDGLRWDSVSNIRGINNGATANVDGETMLVDILNAVHMQFPRTLQVAEDLATIDYVTQSTGQNGLGFDSQWDAAFFHPVDDNVIVAADTSRSMTAIAGAISHQYNGQFAQRVVYTEDHDEVANGKSRIPEMISPGDAGSLIARQRSTLGAAIVMTSPGIPMIFMGQEFLENGHFSDTNPLDWTKTTTYAGILQEYTDLIALRRNVAGSTAGLEGGNVNVFHVNDTAKVLAYHRWKSGGAGDDVVVVANFSAKPFTAYQVGLPRPGVWHARFSSDALAYSPDYAGTPTPDVTSTPGARDGYAQSGLVQLGAYEVLILSQ
jgi:1,4-alpha-glucan branching enzyme